MTNINSPIKGIEHIKAKIPAKNKKNKIIRKIEKGPKPIACQCFFTYFQESDHEKKSFPFNCLRVTLLTAVQEIIIQNHQMSIPVIYITQLYHEAVLPKRLG